jgi:phosphoribosylformylglycinamidine cyclo-ligase
MAVNDLVSVGAIPLVVHAYWATSGSQWFDDEERMAGLVEGWKRACDEICSSWGGGETPGLQGVISEGACDLAASCMGIVRPKERLCLGERLEPGDAIVLLESSGIHANGISLARKLASVLTGGYETLMPNGRMFGEALLDPTILYVTCVRDLFEAGADIKYISNITGHGWRKVMRHSSDFTYIIDSVPPVPEVLAFIVEKAGMSAKDAYATFNMGAGYALFMPENDVAGTIEVCRKNGIKAYRAGVLARGKRSVVIEPFGIEYEGESLALRG